MGTPTVAVPPALNEDPAKLTSAEAAAQHGRAYKRASNAVTFLKTNPFVQLLAIVVASLGFAFAVFTAWDLLRQAEDRAEERVMRAWEILARKISGNTGKGTAINVILDSGSDLPKLDLSCKAMNTQIDNVDCWLRKPVYVGVDLRPRGGQTEPTGLDSWNLAGAELRQWRAAGASFGQVSMAGAEIWESDFRAAMLQGDFEDVTFWSSDLRGAYIMGMAAPATFTGSNLSGVTFVGSDWRGKLLLDHSWAWADLPPQITGGPAVYAGAGMRLFSLCDPVGRTDDEYTPSVECDVLTEKDARARFPDGWRFISAEGD